MSAGRHRPGEFNPMRNPKLLFTPGPLTTSDTVKQAMLRDLGSRDSEFLEIVSRIRRRLLELGNADGSYEDVLMQGSGTFAVESVLSSTIHRGGKLLVAINGAYGQRMAKIASVLGIDVSTVAFPETDPVDPAQIDEILSCDPEIGYVGAVHCETTTGMLNPIEKLGRIVRQHKCAFIVDAMSSFGGIPIDLVENGIDFLVSSANKCIQGVPGFGFVLAKRELLMQSKERARSVSLDLVSQWKGLETDGQFRFTPPTHVLLAFWQALEELAAEGGVAGRASRYTENHQALMAGMNELGFEPYLAPEYQSYIITSFRYPAHEKFEFPTFYRRLSDQGFIIYPGKVTGADCFRIGTIGHIFPIDVKELVNAIGQTLHDMQVDSASAAVGA